MVRIFDMESGGRCPEIGFQSATEMDMCLEPSLKRELFFWDLEVVWPINRWLSTFFILQSSAKLRSSGKKEEILGKFCILQAIRLLLIPRREQIFIGNQRNWRHFNRWNSTIAYLSKSEFDIWKNFIVTRSEKSIGYGIMLCLSRFKAWISRSWNVG